MGRCVMAGAVRKASVIGAQDLRNIILPSGRREVAYVTFKSSLSFQVLDLAFPDSDFLTLDSL